MAFMKSNILIIISIFITCCFSFNYVSGLSNYNKIGEETIEFTSGLDNITDILKKSPSPVGRQTIGEIDFISSSFLDTGQEIKKSIAKIDSPIAGYGTGFLISDSLLITNNHVFDSIESTENSVIEFNYEIDRKGNPLNVSSYTVDKSLFYTNPELDYTILKLNGHPGKTWSYISLSDISSPEKGNKTNIIHHPAGTYKTLSLLDGKVENINPDGFVKYTSDTIRGSSGAPVFNLNWELIALHHFSGDQDITGAFLNNEGIMIDKIINDLKSKVNSDDQVKKIVEEANLK